MSQLRRFSCVVSLVLLSAAGCGDSLQPGAADAVPDPPDPIDAPDGPPPPDAGGDAAVDAPAGDPCTAAGGRIVFATTRAGGDADIAIMRADGGDVAVLTDNTWPDLAPQASVDRTRLAWLAAPGTLQLHVARLDGSDRRELPVGPVVEVPPRWSATGRLAVVSQRDRNVEVYALDGDGDDIVNLTRDLAVDTAPAWSPDGSRVAFVSERGVPAGDPAVRENRIYTMAADGSGLVALEVGERGEWRALAWSPDGHRLAGVLRARERGGTAIRTRLMTMTPSGAGLAQIGRPEVRDYAWSPDGTRIAFEQNGNLHTASPIGAALVEVSLTGLDRSPTWSPDGASLAFVSERDGNAEVYRARADGTAVVNLTADASTDSSPQWLPCE
jgi:Tol biopolymer transport system component